MFGWRLEELRGKRHDNIPAKLHREREMLWKQIGSGHSIAASTPSARRRTVRSSPSILQPALFTNAAKEWDTPP